MEEKTEEELEADISRAMLARISDFKEEADKLTLEGVRRALEKDLGLKKLSLDAHKKFIKQCLDKFYYGAEDMSKTEEKVAEEPLLSEKEEASRELDDFQPAADLKNSNSDINGTREGSPALVGEETPDRETEKESLDPESDSDISEDAIKKAIRKRAAYLRSNLQITLVKVRRLLEEDLKLEKNSLDAYKKLIGSEVDEILQSSETVESTNGDKKEHKKASNSKGTGKTKRGAKKARDSDSSDSKDAISENEESDDEVRIPKKRPAKKINTKSSKKQKTSTEKKTSASGKKKPVEPDLEKGDESGDGKYPEGSHSESSGEEEDKKKSEKPTQVYGKKVEHLKSIIKSCGMGIPPSVYKRAKQAPESKREAFLIQELEEILDREGLSTNPSEKDIKYVKKKKERAKELEGIDMSNIVTSSRRRTTSSCIPPPKPKIESDSDEDEENEEDEDDDNSEDSDDGDSEGGHMSEGSDEEDVEEESD
ncbi:eukaryotic translation initiation factor 5B-like [Iris pallida]|uniref:Eukaryotic translation initiation factor 5B-like n=1 Tax=Iris pallida TaxID=29817 RepID=A0AAX6EMZ0_IRIPA|nr:eukaryotic translation initiation factor 5B-like [Iris pallida]